MLLAGVEECRRFFAASWQWTACKIGKVWDSKPYLKPLRLTLLLDFL
jgi:hypothetical protein